MVCERTSARHADPCNGFVQIFGPAEEADKIPGLDVQVAGGQTIEFGGTRIEVLDVGGHTKGHVAYFVPSANAAFVGDALFSLVGLPAHPACLRSV